MVLSSVHGKGVLRHLPRNSNWDITCVRTLARRLSLVHMKDATKASPLDLSLDAMKQSTWVSYIYIHRVDTHADSCIDKPQYMCSFPDCDAKFAKWSELQHHIMNDHPVTCSFCDREFDRQSRLTRHIKRKHIKRDPVPCAWPGCDQTFSSVSSE